MTTTLIYRNSKIEIYEWKMPTYNYAAAEGEEAKLQAHLALMPQVIADVTRLVEILSPFMLDGPELAYFISQDKEDGQERIFTKSDMIAFAITCSLLSLGRNGSIDDIVNDTYDKNYKN